MLYNSITILKPMVNHERQVNKHALRVLRPWMSGRWSLSQSHTGTGTGGRMMSSRNRGNPICSGEAVGYGRWAGSQES